MAGWDDPAFVSRLRDYVRTEAAKIVEALRPRPGYAEVIEIDRVNRKAMVQYEGDPAPVAVQMGVIQPLTTGQRVRIEGVKGDRYITDVVDGQAYFDGELAP